MSNTTISPNMNLPVPTVGVDPGPDWANNYDACLNAIDSHNHSIGQGVQIGPDGININADLPINENNLTRINAAQFTAINSALTALLDSLQVVGVDLYFVDGNGNAVRITQSGAVTGATGTITGLPSGTASASYAAGTFTFQGATNTPATMAIGPIVTGAAVANSKTVTLAAGSSQPANYGLTWPLAQGAGSLVNDGAGNLSFQALGTVVQASANSIAVSGPTLIAGITLTAGTWLISAGIDISYVTGPASASFGICVNTLSGSFVGTNLGINQFFGAALINFDCSLAMPGYIVTPSGSTNYYVNAFNAQPSTGAGSIVAVRLA